MNLKTFLLLLTLSPVLLSCSNSDQIDSYFGFDIPKSDIDAHLEAEMERLAIPGMSVAFINNGQVVHHRTMGYANVEEQLPVTDKTIFEAASLSKSVFAYFVMQYVDAGLLELDVPLYTYLPYPDIAHDERYKKITARMVLSHRTGFPNWRTDLPDDQLTIAFEPGTEFLYSGEGYQYLAMVLKHLNNTTWEGLEAQFQANVTAPLGMERTVFIQDDFSKANKAEPYDEDGTWISPEMDWDSLFRYQFRAPASIHSEALDFSKWLIGLMNQQGLEQASFEEMYSPHSYVGDFGGIGVDYTLGFYKPQIPLTNIYMHGGNNYGFTAWFSMDPEKQWGYVLFTNSEYGEQLGGELMLDLFFGPNPTTLYVLVGVVVLVVLTLLFLVIRFLVRRIKALILLLLCFLPGALFSQQVADTAYAPIIERPSYDTGKGSVVFIDEGHNNFHTKDGRYTAFARLLERDGYHVKAYAGAIEKDELEKGDIFVISNALHASNIERWTLPNPSAFTKEEIATMEQWVEEGGSLFLIADHMPMAGAAEDLAKAFGFEFTNGFVFDTLTRAPAFFDLKSGMLTENIITKGRDANEAVREIVTFTGQAFNLPDDATPILTFDDSYANFLPKTAWKFDEETTVLSAEGWSQGAFKTHGKGKVVVFGEAAMFTAQLAGPSKRKMGMNNEIAPENYQLLLNIIHWLDGLLEE